MVRYLLIPPVEELLNVCRPTFKVINKKPVKGLVIKSIVDLAPLGSSLECEVKLQDNIKISSIKTCSQTRTWAAAYAIDREVTWQPISRVVATFAR